MIAVSREDRMAGPVAQLWEVALRETVWTNGFRFAPDVRLACQKRDIPLPIARRPFLIEGERFVAFGFEWPEDAVAFLAHFSGSGFAAHVSMPARTIFRSLRCASVPSPYENLQ